MGINMLLPIGAFAEKVNIQTLNNKSIANTKFVCTTSIVDSLHASGHEVYVKNISAIQDISMNITQGDNLVVPATVIGVASDLTNHELPVVWGDIPSNTANAGTFKVTGIAQGYSDSVNMVINIAKKRENYVNLQNDIQSYLNTNINNIGVTFKDLDTGVTFSINGEQQFKAASTAKLPIVMVMYDLIAAGVISEDKEVYYSSGEYEGGCGVLQYSDLSAPYTFGTLAEDAMLHSDNIALIMIKDNMCGSDEMASRLKTLIGRDLMNDSYENVLSSYDASTVLSKLYTGAQNGNTGYQKIVGWLKKSDFHDRLDRDLDHSIVAHKIGNLDDVTNDIGIFYTNRPYTLSIYTEGLGAPEDTIAQISDKVYDYQEALGDK